MRPNIDLSHIPAQPKAHSPFCEACSDFDSVMECSCCKRDLCMYCDVGGTDWPLCKACITAIDLMLPEDRDDGERSSGEISPVFSSAF